MSRKSSLWVAVTFTLVAASLGARPCRADEFEDKLLKQFQKQRASEALELKREVADALLKAETLAPASLEKVRKALRAGLSRLLDDSQLPRDERLRLVRQVKSRLGGLTELAAAKDHDDIASESPPGASSTERHTKSDEAPRSTTSTGGYARKDRAPRRTGQGAGGFAQAEVTPVVSADRRFVRLGVSGSWAIRSPITPWTPIQVAVPTILYGGPPTGVTVGRPIRIFQIFIP